MGFARASVEIGINVTQRIVDFMRHACCQLADGSHFFRLDQMALRLFELLVQLDLLVFFQLQRLVGDAQLRGALIDDFLDRKSVV